MRKLFLSSLVSGVIFAMLSPVNAWAHATYKDSNPGKDATVAQPPSEVWVEFTEAIDQGSVSVYDPCGQQVDNGDSQKNLTEDRVTVTMSADKAGSYRVHWVVLAKDSHQTEGDFNFTSSGGTECPGTQEPKDDNTNSSGGGRDGNDRNGENQSTNATSDGGSTRTTGGGTRSKKPAHDHKHGTDNNKTSRQRRRSVEKPQKLQALPQGDTSRAASGIWDGIPMDDFLVALGVAALIGAAGGRIYAGIIGPRH